MNFLRRLTAILRPTVEEYNDPVFGPLRRESGGAWYGEVSFAHPPTGASSMSLQIEAGKDRPTEGQRAFCREIVERYADLWPWVAKALANDHPDHKTVEAVARNIDEPCLCLDPLVDGEPRGWSLQFTFDDPNEGDMGYFVEFREWEIVGVSSAD